ncbi:MAG: hydrolase [Planctomycetes bacterium]|nr:hydrolase [Planctomycetota bacterium]
MPFTPFHFGPGGCLGLVGNRYLDLPAFLLANVVVDVEPLVVMTFRLDNPLHGYFHTFLVGGLVGLVWGVCVYGLRGVIKPSMELWGLVYKRGLVRAMVSGVLGVWLHVCFDGMIYSDIRPFFPEEGNPLLGLVGAGRLYSLCTLAFLPAVGIYILMVWRGRKTMKNSKF